MVLTFDDNFLARFWEKVDKTTDCWNWIAGTRGKTGYGAFNVGNHKIVDAHRISWILHFGEIPYKICVLHKCDNRRCVNPGHLFLGTRKDNHDDMVAKGRKVKPTIGRQAPVRHGTIDEYRTFGCRCDECKLAHRDRQRKWRANRKIAPTAPEPDL